MRYCVFDSLGEIKYFLGGDEPVPSEVSPGCDWVVCADDVAQDTHWVDVVGSAIMEKTELSLTFDKSSVAADGADVATISGVPAGVSVSFNGAEPAAVTGDQVQFGTFDAGDHSLVFTSIKHLPLEVTIAAH